MTAGGRPARIMPVERARRRRISSTSCSALDSEIRPAQRDYAGAATHAFAAARARDGKSHPPRRSGNRPRQDARLSRAAYLWARRNNAPVWVSTYTKNLQRQFDQETMRLVARSG